MGTKGIDEVKDTLIQAVKIKAEEMGGVMASRQEADSEAVYYVTEDGDLETTGYAEGDDLNDLHLYELAYILEFGEAPEGEELDRFNEEAEE